MWSSSRCPTLACNPASSARRSSPPNAPARAASYDATPLNIVSTAAEACVQRRRPARAVSAHSKIGNNAEHGACCTDDAGRVLLVVRIAHLVEIQLFIRVD